ncbi:MAG: hypothetical protein BroJett040_02620 [Oligoflexia bacterium]|nr:MAG: hypothetical protein BroJett040_02620 [Oligoflexia bacterium]
MATLHDPLKKNIPVFLKTISMKSTQGSGEPGPVGWVYVLGIDDRNHVSSLIERHSLSWHMKQLKETISKEVIHFSGQEGPVWILCRKNHKGPFSHHARLEESNYAWMREQVGSVLQYAKAYSLKKMNFELISTEDDQDLGALVGLELSAYSFKNILDDKSFKDLPHVVITKSGGRISKEIYQKALAIGAGVNQARHLVNTPPNYLHPLSFASYVSHLLKGKKKIKVEVWNEKRLQKEGMGLHLGVGQGGSSAPCMVHISYRPSQKKKLSQKVKPIAFVGKGITFDTGGLDIKPSSGMRLMKKDMGGAGSLVGLAYWLSESDYSRPVDIYLGLAENSIDSKSMRPSDVLVARNGMKIEIHNTDAEGRLVLGDVMDVAISQKGSDEPELVIDVATLTGAIKAGLGSEIAGLFSNHDGLAEELNRMGTAMGELNWRMPLYSPMARSFSSSFADIVNSTDGFGGAVTAALFLERFVKGKPWAHLDIYAWNDKATGSLAFAGGNGQPVQTLISFLELKAQE